MQKRGYSKIPLSSMPMISPNKIIKEEKERTVITIPEKNNIKTMIRKKS
jgi:hypothetical protein